MIGIILQQIRKVCKFVTKGCKILGYGCDINHLDFKRVALQSKCLVYKLEEAHTRFDCFL